MASDYATADPELFELFDAGLQCELPSRVRTNPRYQIAQDNETDLDVPAIEASPDIMANLASDNQYFIPVSHTSTPLAVNFAKTTSTSFHFHSIWV